MEKWLAHDTRSILDIPVEIMIDILLRLPTESVLICRCVCKTLNALTITPDFAAMHHRNLALAGTHHLFYVFYKFVKDKDGPGSYLDRIVNRSLVVQEEVDKSIFPVKHIPLPISSKNCSIIGSCNGLFCVYVSDYSDFWLWNPVTNKTRCLPKIPGKIYRGWRRAVHAFGLIPETNEYMIVQIQCRSTSPHIQVYRQSSDAWSIVKDTSIALSTSLPMREPFQIYALDVINWTTARSSLHDIRMDVGGAFSCVYIDHSYSSTFLKGAFHWTGAIPICERHEDCFIGIVSFDVRDEKLRLVDVLSHAMAPDVPTKLGVLNESLCLIGRGYNNNTVNIWLMNDYGNRESWTKQFRIEETHEFYPIGCWKDYLLLYGTELTMYNLATGERKNLAIQREEHESFEPLSYFGFVETLLPVDLDSQLVKNWR